MSARARTAATWSAPVLFTSIALAWSVLAIGDLLEGFAPFPVPYVVGALYDGVWLYTLWQGREHRRQGSTDRTPDVLGWSFLALSVAILLTHGLMGGGWFAAAAGALVPVIAKTTLHMAISSDGIRISEGAQKKLDQLRAEGRDRTAIARVASDVMGAGRLELAGLEKAEKKTLGEVHTTLHGAQSVYDGIVSDHPGADVPDDYGLFTDADIQAILSGGVRGVSPQVDTPPDTPPDTPHTDPFNVVDAGRLKLLAAETYALLAATSDEDPPSWNSFRKELRAEMDATGLKGGTALMQSLYRQERGLAGHPLPAGQD